MNRFKMTLIALALAALADAGHATGSKPSTPAPTPATPAATPVYVGGSPVSSSTAAGGHALSGSVSGAQSGSSASSGASVGDVSAAGGQGGVGAAAAAAGDSSAVSGGSTSGSSLTSQGGDTRAIGLSFAPGATTPPMPTNGTCAVTITQSSFNVGMGLWSAAKSSSDPRICHLIEQRNRFERLCLFASMKQVDDMLTAELLPGFKVPETMYAISPQDAGYVDMTPDKCAARKPPVMVVAPPAPPVAPPPAPAPAPLPEKVSLSAKELFAFDKAVLTDAGKAKLNELAARLQGETANVVITGHTDSIGSEIYNQSLSMRRANAVRAHLALAGVDLSRMVAIGKGKTEPIADNSTEAGRQLNRRVDVEIIVPAASPKLASLAR